MEKILYMLAGIILTIAGMIKDRFDLWENGVIVMGIGLILSKLEKS